MKFHLLIALIIIISGSIPSSESVYLRCNTTKTSTTKALCNEGYIARELRVDWVQDEPKEVVTSVAINTLNNTSNFTRIPADLYDLFPNMTILTLINIKFKSLQKGDLMNLEHLYLHNSSIRVLNTDTFLECPEMRILKLSNNRIRDIKKDAFRGLNELRYLDLSHNQLTAISKETFNHLSALTNLAISDNPFKSPGSDFLLNLPTTLQILSANNCSLTDVPQEALEKFPALHFLDLSKNFIECINVTSLTDLETLNLNGNKLITISSDMFPESSLLVNLHFGGNQIDSVDATLFDHCQHLSVVTIGNNPCVVDKNPRLNDPIGEEKALSLLQKCFDNFINQ